MLRLATAGLRVRALSSQPGGGGEAVLFYENLGPRKNKGMLMATGWSILTTCTFTFFEFIHVPAPPDATLMVKIISSESWNFAGMFLGPIICYGNYKYGNYLVSEMTKSGDAVGIRTHNMLGYPAKAIKKYNVGEFQLEGYGKTNDLLEYRIANSNQRYIFNREQAVEDLFAGNGGPKPMGRPAPPTPESIMSQLVNTNKRGGGLKRVRKP